MFPVTRKISRRDIKRRPVLIIRHFHHLKQFKMPLVVPGITSQGGDKSKTEEWSNKLVGKKLGEGSDATVSTFHILLGRISSNHTDTCL